MTDLIEDLIGNLIIVGFAFTCFAVGIIGAFGIPLLIIYLFLLAMHFLYTGVW